MGQHCSSSSRSTEHHETTSTLAAFNVDMTPQEVFGALEYVSRTLRRNGLHIQLVVSGEALDCLSLKSKSTCREITVYPTANLSPKSEAILARVASKAGVKFGLGVHWIKAGIDKQIAPEDVDDVVYQSLVQNEVVFSSEGLVLIAIDYTYALKAKLETMTVPSWSTCTDELDSSVGMLRKIVIASRGRPLSAGYVRRHYRRMDVSDHALLRLNAEYERRYGSRGVVGVNDEYIGWRREGVADWNMDFEEIRTEVSMVLQRGACGTWDNKALPDTPHTSIIQQIFANGYQPKPQVIT